MKTLKIFLKPFSYLIAFLVLFQGCTVYKSTPVSLEYASEIGTPVRIEKTDGKKLKLLKVEKSNDGNYYGNKNEHGFVKQILLNEDGITKVELKDKTKSTIRTIVCSVLIAIPLTITVGGIAGGGFY